MTLLVSPEMTAKLQQFGDHAILDSEFVELADGTKAERTHGTKGTWISSPADDWKMHGPFGRVPR